MDSTEFWQLIGRIDIVDLERGNDDAAVRPLQDALSDKSETELIAFGEELARKLHTIDGEIYARNAGDSGGSDDGFLYARCHVVAKGKRFYEAVAAAPNKMPKSIQWCEALLYSHRRAWAINTGHDVSEWPFKTLVSYESGSNEQLWRTPSDGEKPPPPSPAEKRWWRFWR